MKNNELPIIARTHHDKISAILHAAHSDVSDFLEEELGRATIVSDEELPKNVVTMNSFVTYQDMETGKESQVTLVYPADADLDQNKISILSPVGSALIGLQEGQFINWPLPSGKKKQLKVLSVVNY